MSIKNIFFRKNLQKQAIEKATVQQIKIDEGIKQTELKPDLELSIKMKRTDTGDLYKWQVPGDLVSAIRLLKILELEVNRRVARSLAPVQQSKIVQATQAVKNLVGLK